MRDALEVVFTVAPFVVIAYAFHKGLGAIDRWSARMSHGSYWARLLERGMSPARALIVAAGIVVVVLLVTKRLFGALLLVIPLVWFLRARRPR